MGRRISDLRFLWVAYSGIENLEVTHPLAASGFRIVAADYVDSVGFFCDLALSAVGGPGADINLSMLRLYDRFVARPSARRGCERVHTRRSPIVSQSRRELAARPSTCTHQGADWGIERMVWYVLSKDSAVNAAERLEDRETAISTAFVLAHRGYEVIELGRIGGSDKEAIGADEIRKLLADYEGGR